MRAWTSVKVVLGFASIAGCYSTTVTLSASGTGVGDDASLAGDPALPLSDRWTFEEVPDHPLYDGGESAALAVDEQGTPHFHYVGHALDTKYATKVGGEWNIETLEPAQGQNMASDMAIGPNGELRIVAIHHDDDGVDEGGDILDCTVGRAGAWEVEAIAPSYYIQLVAVALDASGATHAAYAERDPTCGPRGCKRVRHATNAGGTWTIEDVDPATQCDVVAIAIDPAGEPRVAYLAGPTLAEVRVAWHDVAGWHPEVAAEVSAEPGASDDYSISYWGTMGFVVDDAGANHLFVPGGALVYATDEDGAWRSEIVFDPPDLGAYGVTAVMDHAGLLHAAWMRASWVGGAEGVFVNRRTTIDAASGRWGAWTLETVVDTMFRVGKLAIDGQDRLHLSYVDEPDRLLVHAVRAPAP